MTRRSDDFRNENRPSNRPDNRPSNKPSNRGYSSEGPINGPKVTPNTPRGTTFRKPPIEPSTSTLWTYPSQNYDAGGTGIQGDPRYAGATPGWVIWQAVHRFTRPGDTVIDPMCGSGTTLDVCRDLGRQGIGFDLVPRRDDIRQADARSLPLRDGTAALAFIDPPYSTHIDYSDDPDCIGRLDAARDDRYFDAMRLVLRELVRVTRNDGVIAVYVSDTIAEGGRFVPIGLRLYHTMIAELGLEPVDIVSVIRGNTKLRDTERQQRAAQGGPLDRGFNYLLLARKGR